MTTKEFIRRQAALGASQQWLASVMVALFCLMASLTALAFTFAYFSN